ncbi:hypothetical protein AAD018_007210 [Aestuariibius insulae]|uniref:hypothetical protein n=1 Tax=Aestuariibius insulae TaxID=2058287 RepID=UPI00345E756F
MSPLSPSRLADLIAGGASITILDLCLPEDFALDPRLIPTSVRMDWTALEASGRVITVCQRGLKISQGAAALLCARGADATFLDSGAIGWAASGLPMIPVENLPQSGLWTVADGPIADIADWILQGFLHGQTLLRVEAEVAETVAERWDAPLIEDLPSFLDAIGLATPALLHVVDAAQNDCAPLSLGRLIKAGDPSRVLDAAYRALRSGGDL